MGEENIKRDMFRKMENFTGKLKLDPERESNFNIIGGTMHPS